MFFIPDYCQNPPLLPVQAPSFLQQCLRLSRSGRRLFVDSTWSAFQESCHQDFILEGTTRLHCKLIHSPVLKILKCQRSSWVHLINIDYVETSNLGNFDDNYLDKMCRYYPQIDVCQSEKDGDIAAKKKELELAAEEDFGNSRVRKPSLLQCHLFI